MVICLVIPVTGNPSPGSPCAVSSQGLSAAKTLILHMPVVGIASEQLWDSFAEQRGGDHAHEALDIPAPQGTPVLATSAGQIVKLFWSERGGITLYQKDPTGVFVFYYAHMLRYADGVHEGQFVRPGEVIGYVGVTGNASPDAPHLHFAVWCVSDPQQWWHGTPINPYPLLKRE